MAPQEQRSFGPELGAEPEANYRRCVEAGEPISYQEELSLPTGTKVWQTKLAPVVTGEEVTCIVGIARDVTDRVHRDEKLRRENRRRDVGAEIAGQCWDMVDTAEASLVVEDDCTIEGDPDRLRHVFENLFRNALEHGGDEVTIRVGRANPRYTSRTTAPAFLPSGVRPYSSRGRAPGRTAPGLASRS